MSVKKEIIPYDEKQLRRLSLIVRELSIFCFSSYLLKACQLNLFKIERFRLVRDMTISLI